MWEFQVNSEGAQSYIYMYPFSPQAPPLSFFFKYCGNVCVCLCVSYILYHIYNKVYHLNYFQVCSPMALSTFTVRQPSPPSIPRTFQHPKQKPSPLRTTSPLPVSLPPALGHHHSISCLCKSDSSRYLLQVESYSICPSCLAFTQHNVPEVQPCGSMHRDALPLKSE